jgi:hypothetical protein
MDGAWEGLFPSVQVHKIPREFPYHNPLILAKKRLLITRKETLDFNLLGSKILTA